jgi:serine/threonine protein kinase
LANSISTGLSSEGQRCFEELKQILERLPANGRLSFLREYMSERGVTLGETDRQRVIQRILESYSELKEFVDHSQIGPPSEESRSISMETTATSPGSTGLSLSSSESIQGTTVGRYRIDELLGRGGFGEVWKGYDPELDRPVAIKLGRRDRRFSEQMLSKLLDEARKAASMSHAGIVQVYDIARVDDGYVIVSEFIDGETLSQRMKSGPVSVDFAVTTVVSIALALHHAHIRDMVHRDVKPGNILLRANGAAVLADFGLAISERDLVREDSVSGTIRYMSPEQARGDGASIDHRSDIFSLGLVLYSMLARRLPYPETDSDSYLRAVATRAPRPLGSVVEDLPPGLSSICMKCLAFSPEGRYSTCRELADALEEWRKNFPFDLSSSSRSDSTVSPPRGAPRWLLVGLIAGIGVLAGIVIYRMKQYTPGSSVSVGPPGQNPSPPADKGSESGISSKTKILIPPSPALDGLDPITVLTPTDAWKPLLREMPHQVAWPSSDGRQPPLFSRGEQQLTVKSERSRWVFQCAEIESQPFHIRTAISVDRWEGYGGVIWGLREDPDIFPVPDIRCLAVEFMRGGPNEPAKLVALSMVLKKYSFDDFRVTKLGMIAVTEIPPPTELETTLEVEVRSNHLIVRFGAGQPWRIVDTLDNTAWLPQGRWAVGITGQGLGVSLRTLSIRSLPGESP